MVRDADKNQKTAFFNVSRFMMRDKIYLKIAP